MTAALVTTTSKPILSESEVMRAVEFAGKTKMTVNHSRPKPKITDANDVIVKVTATTICGSDLHLYHKLLPGVNQGDILGHEAVGVVESVGQGVQDLSIGDRVVVSAIIADGSCAYCKEGRTSLCDTTNPSEDMRKMYGGFATAGLFGYSELTGGYPGTQAEFLRVPHADFNCLKIPSDKTVLSDEQALLLSDVACTAWHGNELADVQQGDAVCVWGAGPIGMLTAYFAAFRGAAKVLVIDRLDDRLSWLKNKVENVDVLNYEKSEDLEKDIKLKFVAHGGGPNKSIDCVGFRFPKTWKHTVESLLSIETDATDVINEMILYTKKGGTIVLIGDYFAYGNHVAVGALMEKSLTCRGGQVFVHRYWKHLLQLMLDDKIQPTFIYTHRVNLEAVPDAYAMFDKRQDGMVKCIIKTDSKDI